MRPGIEHALGIEAFLDALGHARRARPAAARTRRPRRAPRRARGSAWRGRRSRRRRGGRRGAGVVGRRQRDPDQPAGPVVEHLRARARAAPRARRRAPARSRPATAAGRRTAPLAANGCDVAHARATARANAASPSVLDRAERLEQRRQRILAVPHRRRDAFEAERRRGLARRRPPKRIATCAGRCAAPDTSQDDAIAAVIASVGARRRRGRATSTVSSVSGFGSILIVTSVIAASVPNEPASSLQRS